MREFGRIVGMCSPSNSALIGLYISTFSIAIRLALSSLYILDGGSRPASCRHEFSTCPNECEVIGGTCASAIIDSRIPITAALGRANGFFSTNFHTNCLRLSPSSKIDSTGLVPFLIRCLFSADYSGAPSLVRITPASLPPAPPLNSVQPAVTESGTSSQVPRVVPTGVGEPFLLQRGSPADTDLASRGTER